MKKIIILTILLMSGVFPFAAGAQSALDEDGSPYMSKSLQSLEQLKHDIAVLMQENNQLEVQYALLQREYATLNEEYQKHAGRLEQLKQDKERETQIISGRRQQIEELEAELPDTETNQLILKSRIAFARQQLLDMDETLRMLKLKSADLEFESKDIEMAKKIKAYSKGEMEKQHRQRLEDLKSNYEKNIELEKELLAEAERIEKEAVNADSTILRLKQGAGDMSQTIEQLKKAIVVRQEQNDLLRKKKLYEIRLSENTIWQYDQKKLALEKSVADLAGRANEIGEKIDVSSVAQAQKRDILDAIIRIDQENQNLKDKIFELQQKIKGIKKL